MRRTICQRKGIVRAGYFLLLRIASRQVASCLRKLPDDVRSQVIRVPVLYRKKPLPEEPGQPQDDSTLGLFVGTWLTDEAGAESVPLPQQIVLYLENIWDYSERNRRQFRRQVRLTYLHEVGHLLGWDEDKLQRRGLG